MESNTPAPQLGDAVTFKNLKAATYNGTIGHLTKYITEEKRWAVRIGGGKQVKARLCNLELLRPVDTKSSNVEIQVDHTYYQNTSMLEFDNDNDAFDGDQALLDITKSLSKMGLYDQDNCAHTDLALACYLSSNDFKDAVSLFIDAFYDDNESNNVEESESVVEEEDG